MKLKLPMKVKELLITLDKLDKEGTPYYFVRDSYNILRLCIDGKNSEIDIRLEDNGVFQVRAQCNVIPELD